MYYSVDTAGDHETPHGQLVKIDTTKPVSHVTALAATATSPNFSVQWSGTDATSGLANYTIYVSDNGGPFAPWLSNVTSAQAYYTGSLLHTYGFYSIAADNAGNVENPKTAAEVTTHVPQMPGDVNGDGQINCADIILVKASFGTRKGQAGFNPSADCQRRRRGQRPGPRPRLSETRPRNEVPVKPSLPEPQCTSSYNATEEFTHESKSISLFSRSPGGRAIIRALAHSRYSDFGRFRGCLR